ncbi:ABC transporter permease [Desulfospira joergensenii]|uniref:ABC transporter permease n=1 Tax=Desulfospira joergensenii TaxID=53329 RepID=UPI0003B3EEFE|nr:ABC transporter permease [Desulfospira joergensenii]
MKFRRLAAIARKEFLHVFRDWRSLFLSLAIPVILIMLFGYALTLDLRNVPTVVWDQSKTPQSRELIDLFNGSPYFSLEGNALSYGELQQSLDQGRAMVAIVVPSDFARKLQGGKETAIQVLCDGSDANTSRLAMNYATAIGMIYSTSITARQMELRGMTGFKPPLELVSRSWYNPDLRSQNVIIPGIIAIVMVVIASMLTSVTIAREWETGTMEQLISTPLKGPELIFGKALPYFAIGMADVAIAVVMGKWLFHVPIVGNAALLFGMAAIFLTGALFWGMTLSIVLKSQVLANQIAIVSGYLPTLILSGFVFAIENMPLPIQCITYIVPARYFIVLLRGIYMKGIGLEILWLDAVLLSVYAVIMMILANRKFKFKLE